MHPRPDWHFKWRGKSPSSIPRRAGFCVSQHFRVVQDGSKAATNSFPGWKKTPPRRRPDMESFLFLGLSLSLPPVPRGDHISTEEGGGRKGSCVILAREMPDGRSKIGEVPACSRHKCPTSKKTAKICRLFLTKAVSLQTSSNPARDTG